MFSALTYPQMRAQVALQNDMFRVRGQQFIDRHGWALTRDAQGREIDNFDCAGTTYCVVHDQGNHLASLRLRLGGEESMSAILCPDHWEAHRTRLAEALEVTRLCSAPHIDERARLVHTAELLLGLCRHGMAEGTPHLFGVVFPGVARAIQRSGWPSDVLARFQLDGRTVFLCAWTCSHAVDWALQERVERLTDAPVFDNLVSVADTLAHVA